MEGTGFELQENWFWTIIMLQKKKKKNQKNTQRGTKSQFSALPFAIWCWAVKSGHSCMQMNNWKLEMWPETDVGIELLSYPGLAVVKVMF